jgi:hypothetical protein
MFNESFSVIVLAKSIPVTEDGREVKRIPFLSFTEVHEKTVKNTAPMAVAMRFFKS